MVKDMTPFTFGEAWRRIKRFRLLRARDTYSSDTTCLYVFCRHCDGSREMGLKRYFDNDQRADEWFCEWYYPDGTLWFAEFFKRGELVARIAVPQPPEHPLPPSFPSSPF